DLDDWPSSLAFAYEGESCLDLGKHGSFRKLVLFDVALRFFRGNSSEELLFVSALVQTHLLHTGKDQKGVCVQFFRQKPTGKIFLDNGACSVEVDTLFHNRDSAAAGCDHDLSCFCKYADGLQFHDLLWFRRGQDPAVLPGSHFSDKITLIFF